MSDHYSIVISGEAGQGLRTIEKLIDQALKRAGYHFFSTSEFMSRIRGGNNTVEIRIGNSPMFAFVDRIDYLLVLADGAIRRLEGRLSPDTLIIGDRSSIQRKYQRQYDLHPVSLRDLADQAGHRITMNTVALGILLGLLNLDPRPELRKIKRIFASKGKKLVDINSMALKLGQREGLRIPRRISLTPQESIKKGWLADGTRAVTAGALTGGCHFVTAYPMSPSTGVITRMSELADEFGLVVEQAEDEIAAINLSIGAWYAGARALVTTSGGGFSLMQEGISLAGITETPAVIHLGQRPGPATGMPTRTEQADLNLAVYSGHGEFPRLVLSPGNLHDAFHLTRRAFELADRYRMIVIILTDQFLLDSISLLNPFNFSGFSYQNHFREGRPHHPTYRFTDSGISPRIVPGHGEGFQMVDSHEHDPWGRLTEDPDLRRRMVDKRMRKLDAMAGEFLQPEVIGSPDCDTLVIGWGSTFGPILEALERLNAPRTACAYFRQVYPLPESTAGILNRAKQTVVVENNAGGQLSRLIRQETGIATDRKILQYDGRPFSVESLVNQIGRIL